MLEQRGFPARRILANAYDSLIRDEQQMQRLWEALKDWEIERRWDVLPPAGFRDPGKVEMYGSMYPKLDSKSAEGKRVWNLSQEIERDPRLKREARH